MKNRTKNIQKIIVKAFIRILDLVQKPNKRPERKM